MINLSLDSLGDFDEYRQETSLARLQQRLKRAEECIALHHRSQSAYGNLERLYQFVGQSMDLTTLIVENNRLDANTEMMGDFGLSQSMGRKSKREQEDRVQCARFAFHTHQIAMSSVFDGHSGSLCSTYCQQNVVAALQQNLDKFGVSDLGMFNALKHTCVDLNATFPYTISGTTANIVVQVNDIVWTANVGDSRAIIVYQDGTAEQLSEDQHIEPNIDETHYQWRFHRGVFKRGGQIVRNRVNGFINMYRAIGDKCLGLSLSARPKIHRYVLKGNELAVVQFSDGITAKKLDTDSIAALCQRQFTVMGRNTAAVAYDLLQAGLNTGSNDNLSAIVRKL